MKQEYAKRLFVPLLLALCLLTVSAAQSEELNAEQIEQLFIHPLCLSETLFPANGEQMPDQIECLPSDYGTTVNAFPKVQEKAFYSADTPHDDDDIYIGSIGYRAADRWSPNPDVDVAVLEVKYDGGGSGRFSSLLVLVKTVNGRSYKVYYMAGGGGLISHDRCNDGNLGYMSRSARNLTYDRAATPFRLLNPVDYTDWRNVENFQMLDPSLNIELPATFQDWRPYEDIENTAQSCVGEIVHQIDYDSGVDTVVGVRLDKEAFVNSSQGKHQQCVNDWIETTDNLGSDNRGSDWIPLYKWQAKLKDLATHCPK